VTKVPPHFQARVDAAKAAALEVESATNQLAEDLKYPVDAYGRVLDMNHLPDVVVTLVYHLIRCGWRPNDDKRMIKQRRVIGGGYYEDLVTYVGVDDSDDPVVVERNPQPQQQEWSVKPTVNMIDEPRND
jgi:hypothetical protein